MCSYLCAMRDLKAVWNFIMQRISSEAEQPSYVKQWVKNGTSLLCAFGCDLTRTQDTFSSFLCPHTQRCFRLSCSVDKNTQVIALEKSGAETETDIQYKAASERWAYFAKRYAFLPWKWHSTRKRLHFHQIHSRNPKLVLFLPLFVSSFLGGWQTTTFVSTISASSSLSQPCITMPITENFRQHNTLHSLVYFQSSWCTWFSSFVLFGTSQKISSDLHDN